MSDPAKKILDPVVSGLLSASQLKRDRGWTDALVKQFCPMPDDFCSNPYYRAGPAVRLYRLDRIKVIEASPEFQEAKARTAVRQAAAKKAGATKRSKALTWLTGAAAPVLPALPRAQLEGLAVDHRNDVLGFKGDSDTWITRRRTSAELVAGLQIDFIRFRLAAFEAKLRQAVGKQLDEEAARLIGHKILEAIAAAYPWLAEECARRIAPF